MNTSLHPFRIRFDLLAEPQFSTELFDLGGARADLQRQHLFLFFIGVPSFFVEWFSLKQRDFKLLYEGAFRVLQVCGGINMVFGQKPVLLQILLKLYRILQKIPADLFRSASLDCPAQQVNIVKIQCAEAVRFGVLLQAALADIAAWGRQLFRLAPAMLRQNALLNGGIGVVFAQTIQPDEALSVGRLDSGVFSVPGVNLITGFSQALQKGRKVERLTDQVVNIPAYLLPDGRLFGLRRLPFLMAFSFAFRQNDGQTVFAAQVVRHLLDFFEVGFHIAA